MENEVTLSGLERNTAGYDLLARQMDALLEGEKDLIANLANISAAIMEFGHFHWVGFYLVKENELVLGPFQGPVACTRIARGKGVCGTSWNEKRTLVLANVHEFEGHIACSPYSNAEIVIPVFNDDDVIAVLDIDSTVFNDFSEIDRVGLENIVRILENHL